MGNQTTEMTSSDVEFAVLLQRFERHLLDDVEIHDKILKRLERIEKEMSESKKLKLHIWAAFVGGVATFLLTQPDVGKRLLDVIKTVLL